ncbi:MAG: GH92 family glycosyl hydrolase [Bacteroidota bacterium]
MKSGFGKLLVLLFSSLNAIGQQVTEPADLVNPLMGTQSSYELSAGNTYPAIALPWGMNFWSPQTGKMGDGWMYSYNANKIRGIKQTHQPSPWINDYGSFSLMPVTHLNQFPEEARASWFSHKAETATPYYYSVFLADHNATAEVTPTDRAAIFRFSYSPADSAFIVVDAMDRGSHIQILPDNKTIVGYSTRNSGGVPENFKNYFVIRFSEPFSVAHTWRGYLLAGDSMNLTGNHTGAIVGFGKTARPVEVKVASSFISEEQAKLNLETEIGNAGFNTIKNNAKAVWNKELGRIAIEDTDKDAVRTFYSCLYRTMLFPRKFYEQDASGKIVHYSPYNGKVLPGYMFTDNGFWDTFRAVFPFFTLLYPDLDGQIMQGLENTYKESGWLPEWASPGHRDCMIGSNSASLITDAYMKGIRGFDIELLYEAMKKNAENEGPLTSVGRKGAAFYNSLGYVPYNVDINENAARTLEYAYADFCLWRLGTALKKPAAETNLFYKRAHNYLNVFDSSRKLMRGKNQDGNFQTPYNPFKWGDAFTEGNAWHYTWSVFQNISDLKNKMGGERAFVGMLDSVFNMPPVFDDTYYGQVIHEIREMQIMNMGQYAHGNQPIQHMPYLYEYTSQPWKTEYWVREIMNRMYHATPDGYCGDEDNGQTSAWYVFSALGFYPVTPGSNQYVIGAPLFKKATIKLQNGRQLIIEAPANNTENKYVQSMLLNNKPWTNHWLSHETLQQGGALFFKMGSKPGKDKIFTKEMAPYSMDK